MVKSRHILLTLGIVFFLVALLSNNARAWSGSYHLGQEWVKIWMNQDGTIDLFYNISLTLDSGDNISYVSIGQPNGDFTIGTAKDQYGHTLSTSDASSGSDYKVQVNLNSPLAAGNTVWFTLTTNVANMIYNSTKNLENFDMEFKPMWWVYASVSNLRLSIVMPSGVTVGEVGTPESMFWNGTSFEDDGRLSIYWERWNLPPNQQYTFGVSFPKKYLPNYQPPSQPSGFGNFLQLWPFLLVGLLIIVLVVVLLAVRKGHYSLPAMSMETLGVRRGLTAVEASYLLDMKPTMLVTEILYSLLHKRAIWVESTKPSLKLQIMQPFQNKTGTKEVPLRYYEIDFLKAIKEGGILDEERLAQTVVFLENTVEEKMRGYCRRDTVAYYKSVVTKAWEQVEQAGTPELASNAYDEQLLWLLLDPNYKSRTETTFHDRAFEPSPMWLWFWFGYQHYNPHPTYRPNVETPAQAGKPPTIPGADFANNIATSLEKTSNNIVVNIEKFANAIVGASSAAKASHEPALHEAGCVCACATCACACACVSCACACAGGGVG
jgi:hypothetical protein